MVFFRVVKHSSIQILLALVAQYELDLNQLDVKTVFLYSDLDEIYMTQPMGFKTAGKEHIVRGGGQCHEPLPFVHLGSSWAHHGAHPMWWSC